MDLNALNEMMNKDMVVDKTRLVDESARTSTLRSKWHKLYTDEKLKFKIMNMKLNALIVEKREYYSGAAAPEVYKDKPFNLKLRTDAAIQKYVDSDPEVIKMKERIVVQELIVETTITALEEVKARGYAIKAMIEMIKFENGAY